MEIEDEMKAIQETERLTAFDKQVAERKQVLVKRLLEMQYRGETASSLLMHVFNDKSWKDVTWYFQHREVPPSLSFDAPKYPDLTIQDSRGKEHSCDFICAEYGVSFQALQNDRGIRRYVYFEVCYRRHVIGCLMSLYSFQKRKEFPELEMDAPTWKLAKRQMSLWKKHVSPLNNDLPPEPPPVPPGLYDRFREISDGFGRDDPYVAMDLAAARFPSEDQIVWPLVTYVTLLQFLHIFPDALFPGYALCFVCKSKDVPLFQKRLKDYLEEFLSYYFLCSPEIQILNRYVKDDPVDNGTAIPYILSVRKESSASVSAVLADINRAAVKLYNVRCPHPFRNRIPILVSTERIPSSSVLNITITDKDLDTTWIDADTVAPQIRNMIVSLAKLFKTKGQEVVRMYIYRAYRKIRGNFYPPDFFPENHPILHTLAIVFTWLYFSTYPTPSLPEAAHLWFEEQSQSWKPVCLTLSDAASALLTFLKSQIPDHTKRPGSKDMFAQDMPVFVKTDQKNSDEKEEDLLCCHPQYLQQIALELFPDFPLPDVLALLFDKGYLRSGKDPKRKLKHAVSLSRATVWCYAFHLQNLNNFTSL